MPPKRLPSTTGLRTMALPASVPLTAAGRVDTNSSVHATMVAATATTAPAIRRAEIGRVRRSGSHAATHSPIATIVRPITRLQNATLSVVGASSPIIGSSASRSDTTPNNTATYRSVRWRDRRCRIANITLRAHADAAREGGDERRRARERVREQDRRDPVHQRRPDRRDHGDPDYARPQEVVSPSHGLHQSTPACPRPVPSPLRSVEVNQRLFHPQVLE